MSDNNIDTSVNGSDVRRSGRVRKITSFYRPVSREDYNPSPLVSSKVAKEFHLFPKLPIEIRLKIWRYAIFPRIVGLKGSKVGFPGVCHANSESRSETKYRFRKRDSNTGLLANPKIDILLMDPISFPSKLEYHDDAFHTIQCHRTRINSTILKPMERVALTIREVMNVWDRKCFHCFLVRELDPMFPSLKELIIILRLGPHLHVEYDDLYEVEDSEQRFQKKFIEDIRSTFTSAQDKDEKLVDVQLKFMRLEHWEK